VNSRTGTGSPFSRTPTPRSPLGRLLRVRNPLRDGQRLWQEVLTRGNHSVTTLCAPKAALQRLNPPPSDRREATTDYAKLLSAVMQCAQMHRHASAFAACYVESDSPSAFRPCSGRETNPSVKQGEIACSIQ
jgi:hypothetical protein